MDVSPLLRLPAGLDLTGIMLDCYGVLLQVEATAQSASCPLCACPATRVHSCYSRTVADLPCAGRRVRLRLHVRRFRCDTPACPRKIFAERLAPFLAPWARMTTRLCQATLVVGLATCGELGARLGERLGIQTSPTTILRRIMAVPSPPPEAVSALGIDDFALLRGRRYHAPHNLAKTVIEFSVCILRAPLRERCGVAYKRAALQQDNRRERE